MTRDQLVAEFRALSDNEQAALILWLVASFVPATTKWKRGTYGLKHLFDSDLSTPNGEPLHGFYVTNEQFAGAVLVAGFALGEYRGGTWPVFLRPRSKRRVADRTYVGRISCAWWTADERDAFAALSRAIDSETRAA